MTNNSATMQGANMNNTDAANLTVGRAKNIEFAHTLNLFGIRPENDDATPTLRGTGSMIAQWDSIERCWVPGTK